MSGCRFPGPILWDGDKRRGPLRSVLGVARVRAETRRSTRENPARRWRSAGPPPLSARAYPRGQGRSARTAHDPSEPLGWAEIRHPFHPLRGQSFPVLKTRCVAGVDTLILRGLECGTFSVAREWTDCADPSPSLGLSPRRWDADLLLDLANLLEQLSSQSSRELPKGD